MFLNPLDLQAGGRREAATFSAELLTRRRRQAGQTAARLAWGDTRMNGLFHFVLLCSCRGALDCIALLLRNSTV